jgi:cytochrome P450
MPYGQAWRNQRKIYQAILSITAVRALAPLQDAESTLTVYQLAQSPERYYDHIRRYSTAVILSSVFGIRGPEFNHPNITRLYHVQDQFTAILETGATPPVDVFPFLKRLPDFVSPWRRWARRIRAEQRQLYFELLQEVKIRRERGIKVNCFISQLLDEKAKYELDDEHIAYIGGVLMEGGSDTTASTLLSFLLAMVKYPKVFRKAQEEVDRVCGTKESPTFELLAQLPYVKHCVSEVGLPCFLLWKARPLTWILAGPSLEAGCSRRYSTCADPRYIFVP